MHNAARVVLRVEAVLVGVDVVTIRLEAGDDVVSIRVADGGTRRFGVFAAEDRANQSAPRPVEPLVSMICPVIEPERRAQAMLCINSVRRLRVVMVIVPYEYQS